MRRMLRGLVRVVTCLCSHGVLTDRAHADTVSMLYYVSTLLFERAETAVDSKHLCEREREERGERREGGGGAEEEGREGGRE